jgi:hypothetical protein
VDQDGVSLIFGPHTDERALSHAWFSMEHAGRLTEFVIALLMGEFGSEETREDLRVLAQKNADLHSSVYNSSHNADAVPDLRCKEELPLTRSVPNCYLCHRKKTDTDRPVRTENQCSG